MMTAGGAAVGTALSCTVGFLLTTVTLPGVPALRDAAGWPLAFGVLALGPAVGIVAMRELVGVTRIAWEGATLELRPVLGATRSLEPVGGLLFRLEGRREATHVVGVSSNAAHTGSDRLRKFEQGPRRRVIARWLSAGAGVVALLYLLLVGGVRTIAALRRTASSATLP